MEPKHEHRQMRCAASVQPPCPNSFKDSGRWARTKAGEAGWFFPRNKDEAFCPDHNPPWVARWRARKSNA